MLAAYPVWGLASAFARRSAICCSYSSASVSVSSAFSPSSFGRSSGVAVTLFQIPCRSGSPHGVFACCHVAALAPDEDGCADKGVEPSATTVTSMTNAASNRRFIQPPYGTYSLCKKSCGKR